MENVPEKFVELQVDLAQKDAALALKPIHTKTILGGFKMIFENVDAAQLKTLGRVSTPSVADLFVAKMQSTVQQ